MFVFRLVLWWKGVDRGRRRLRGAWLWGVGALVAVLLTNPVIRFVDAATGRETLRTVVDSTAAFAMLAVYFPGVTVAIVAAEWVGVRWRVGTRRLISMGRFPDLVVLGSLVVLVAVSGAFAVAGGIGPIEGAIVAVTFAVGMIADRRTVARTDAELAEVRSAVDSVMAPPVAESTVDEIRRLAGKVDELAAEVAKLRASGGGSDGGSWVQWWRARPRRAR